MELLKRIPVKYTGELHDVRLINFSVDLNEVCDRVPAKIKIRDFNGRALISMVDVKLRNMHPVFLPEVFNFNYRHIGFRLLVDDSAYNNGSCKGIYFLQSFTTDAFIVRGGSLFTDYKLEKATITEDNNVVFLKQQYNFFTYTTGSFVNESDGQLKNIIGGLDRAYSVLGNNLRVTLIQREKWPIKEIECRDFKNTFFTTARFEGAFRLAETIYYNWLPPEKI
jgi:hypothetical protein